MNINLFIIPEFDRIVSGDKKSIRRALNIYVTIQKIMDKYTKRVLLFVILMSIITTPIPLAMTQIGPVEAIVLILFFTLDTTGTKFPLDFFFLMLHTILASVLTGIPFIGKTLIWGLIVTGSAVVLYILLITIGATLPIDLYRGYTAFLIFHFTVLVLTFAVSIGVHYGTGLDKLALAIVSIGLTAQGIPIVVICGQAALGRPQFRTLDGYYYKAAFCVHMMLILLLSAINIGIPYLILDNVLKDQVNHFKMTF
ncbi:unnamed protein product [Trichobilharzia szidati]|nr:unnamed protein product [Trichobilharzia szidati]